MYLCTLCHLKKKLYPNSFMSDAVVTKYDRDTYHIGNLWEINETAPLRVTEYHVHRKCCNTSFYHLLLFWNRWFNYVSITSGLLGQLTQFNNWYLVYNLHFKQKLKLRLREAESCSYAISNQTLSKDVSMDPRGLNHSSPFFALHWVTWGLDEAFYRTLLYQSQSLEICSCRVCQYFKYMSWSSEPTLGFSLVSEFSGNSMLLLHR